MFDEKMPGILTFTSWQIYDISGSDTWHLCFIFPDKILWIFLVMGNGQMGEFDFFPFNS